jgi:hypothetical protein
MRQREPLQKRIRLGRERYHDPTTIHLIVMPLYQTPPNQAGDQSYNAMVGELVDRPRAEPTPCDTSTNAKR